MSQRRTDGRPRIAAAFPHASPQTLGRLASTGRDVRVGPNSVLLDAQADLEARRVYLVTEGFVALDLEMADDRRALVMILPEGNLIGLLDTGGEPEPFRVVTLTATALLGWPARTFRDIGLSDPGLLRDVVDTLAGRLPYAMRLAGLFALASTRSRLATLLLAYEYLCFHPRHPVIGRGALPALAAASREMTNRTLRDWEASGVIRRHGLKGLELRDPRRLSDEAAMSGFHPLAPLNQARPVLEPVGGHGADGRLRAEGGAG